MEWEVGYQLELARFLIRALDTKCKTLSPFLLSAVQRRLITTLAEVLAFLPSLLPRALPRGPLHPRDGHSLKNTPEDGASSQIQPWTSACPPSVAWLAAQRALGPGGHLPGSTSLGERASLCPGQHLAPPCCVSGPPGPGLWGPGHHPRS